MGDVLSQNEIDNLLAALSTGELDVSDINDGSDKPVKNYDFRRPGEVLQGASAYPGNYI